MGLQPFRGNGQYSHLNGRTSVDLDNRLTLLSLEQSEESETLPFEMTLLFDLLYEYNKRPGRTINAIDEAHQLLQNPASLNWLERSLRYSGHFDASFAMLTQSAEDFLVNPAARTIASNCSIKVYFRDKGMTTDHGDYLGLSPREVRFVNQATPGDRARGYSQCLLDVDGHGTRPLRVEGLPSELEIIDPLDDDEREALPDDQLSSWRASV
jgi:type IV secretory pathway VirB4 component